jgi:hypothetical protein
MSMTIKTGLFMTAEYQDPPDQMEPLLGETRDATGSKNTQPERHCPNASRGLQSRALARTRKEVTIVPTIGGHPGIPTKTGYTISFAFCFYARNTRAYELTGLQRPLLFCL